VWKIRTYAKSLNATWDNVDADYWSVLEANIGVFCMCMVSILSCILSADLLRAIARSAPLSCSPRIGMDRRNGRQALYNQLWPTATGGLQVYKHQHCCGGRSPHVPA
jgi:hypothetical protein